MNNKQRNAVILMVLGIFVIVARVFVASIVFRMSTFDLQYGEPDEVAKPTYILVAGFIILLIGALMFFSGRKNSSQVPNAQLGNMSPNAINNQVQFCTECGSKVDPQHRFCTNCGHKFYDDIKPDSKNLI